MKASDIKSTSLFQRLLKKGVRKNGKKPVGNRQKVQPEATFLNFKIKNERSKIRFN